MQNPQDFLGRGVLGLVAGLLSHLEQAIRDRCDLPPDVNPTRAIALVHMLKEGRPLTAEEMKQQWMYFGRKDPYNDLQLLRHGGYVRQEMRGTKTPATTYELNPSGTKIAERVRYLLDQINTAMENQTEDFFLKAIQALSLIGNRVINSVAA